MSQMSGEPLAGSDFALSDTHPVPEMPVEAISGEAPSPEPAPRRVGRWRKFVAATTLVAVAATAASCRTETEYSHPDSHQSTVQVIPPPHETEVPPTIAPPENQQKNRPNVVMVLTDDLDTKLMTPQIMPNLYHDIISHGVTLHVEDEQSLCCPARTTVFTGQFSRNTHVDGNVGETGGFAAFHKYDESHDLMTWLHSSGVKTMFEGKYLNGFPSDPTNVGAGVTPDYVPPGVDKFEVPVGGQPYLEYNIRLDMTGNVQRHMHHGYYTRILARQALGNIRNTPVSRPYFLDIDTFAPHKPYTPPKKLEDSPKFRHLPYPENPNFNEANISDKPFPMDKMPPLSHAEIKQINKIWRWRALSTYAVDQMIGRIYDEVKARHQLADTYFVFGSDNGYRMGEHRLPPGKYDWSQETLNVPYVISGPGILHGVDMKNLLAGDVDIAPTIAALFGVRPKHQVDGISLLPYLEGRKLPSDEARHWLLISRGHVPQYKHVPAGIDEPPEIDNKVDGSKINDFTGAYYKGPLGHFVYVTYTDPKYGPRRELFDLQRDPYELNNLFGPHGGGWARMNPRQRTMVRQAKNILPQLDNCAGTTENGAANPCNR